MTENRKLAYSWIVWILLALVLAVGGLVFARRPGRAILRVEGTPGTEFIGHVNVDGSQRFVSGVVPDEFEFTGRRIEAIVISREGSDQSFTVGINGAYVGNKLGAEGRYVMDWGFPHWSLNSIPEAVWQQYGAEWNTAAAVESRSGSE